jgi:pyruvate dehydrogenase E1 component
LTGGGQAHKVGADDWDVAADLWSAPSWVLLHRDGVDCEEWSRMHPAEDARVPYVTATLGDTEGPVLAVSDWQKAVPGLIARWVPGHYAVLGTDGFGRSDTRPALRRLYRIDAENIAAAVLHELALTGEVKLDVVDEAIGRYELDREVTPKLP